MEKKNNNTLIILLLVVFLGLPFLVGCVGILAAIAIPSFLRYIKASKVSEPAAITRMLGSTVEMGFLETCAFPEPLPPTFDPTSSECCGGNKCMPTGALPEYWAANTSTLGDPKYFAYSAAPGPDNTYVVTAMADMTCGGPLHTVTVTVQGQGGHGGCGATVGPPITQNEFE